MLIKTDFIKKLITPRFTVCRGETGLLNLKKNILPPPLPKNKKKKKKRDTCSYTFDVGACGLQIFHVKMTDSNNLNN